MPKYDLDFYEAWDRLDETVRFNKQNLNASSDIVFKFLATINDLNSALVSNTIWINKHSMEGLQYDDYCDKLSTDTGVTWGYVSLTTEPTKVALELTRPFGLAFDLESMKDFIEKQEFKYRAFDQFKQTEQLPKNSSDAFRIGVLGKRWDGSYCVALQGGFLPRDIDKATYDRLVNWLKSDSKDQLVHFIFPNGSNPIEVNSHKAGQKEELPRYKYSGLDFADPNYLGEASKNFVLDRAAGLVFNSNIRDYSEIWATTLNKSMGLTCPSGQYKKHIYNTKVSPIVSPQTNVSYALDSGSYNVLREVLNEYEYRIYLPASKIFKYPSNLLKAVQLPNCYPATNKNATGSYKRYVRLEEIFNAFEKLSSAATDDVLSAICDEHLLLDDLETKLVISLYRILKIRNIPWNFFNYEVVPERESTNIKRISTPFADEIIDNLPEIKAAKWTDKNLNLTRYITNKERLSKVFLAKQGTRENADDLEYRVIKLVDSAGYPSLIYRDFSPDGSEAKRGNARLQVRGILLGQDEFNNWYINVIHKGSQFDELPGGSFDSLPSSESGLTSIAARKFNSEVGIDISTNELQLLDIIAYMYEPQNTYITKLTKGTDLAFPYTVDWLFIGDLGQIDSTALKKNNDGESRWSLVSHIIKESSFLQRYRNIVDVIKNYTNAANNNQPQSDFVDIYEALCSCWINESSGSETPEEAQGVGGTVDIQPPEEKTVKAINLNNIDNLTAGDIIPLMREKPNGYGYASPDLKFQRYYNAWVYENIVKKIAGNKIAFKDTGRDILKPGGNNDDVDFSFTDNNIKKYFKTLELKLYQDANNSYGTTSFHDADIVLILGLTGKTNYCAWYKTASGDYDKIDLTSLDSCKKQFEGEAADSDYTDAIEELFKLLNEIGTKVTPSVLKNKMKRFRFDFEGAEKLPLSVTDYK